jgi:hypothetical protein
MRAPDLIRRFSDNTSSDSVATRLRRQRFQILEDMIQSLDGAVSILDIGGRPGYWASMLAGADVADRVEITLLNVDASPESDSDYTMLVGDARAIPEFSDNQFDIVFSNSTIEHVGGWADQVKMADEVRRIGQRYCVQTPNRHFPIEPHYVFPLFHFLPITARASLVQHFALGWMPKHPEREKAVEAVSSIQLLARDEFARLFPGATIAEEPFYGLVKSFVAYTP